MKRAVPIVTSVLVLIALAMTGCVSLSPDFTTDKDFELKPAADQDRGLRAQFFGTTTVLISDGETSVMVDGFFSRPGGWLRLVLGTIEPNQKRIDHALGYVDRHKLRAVMVAHSHHDHALDSAVVAQQTGAFLVGSESTENIARGAKLEQSRIRVVTDGDRFCVGSFEVTVIESPHSRPRLFPGALDAPLRAPAHVWDYKPGKNYNFLLRHAEGTVLIVPSANFKEGRLKDVKADVVFLGVADMTKRLHVEDFIADYWREVVLATQPTLVIPIHWDDFTRSLDEPLKPMPLPFDNTPRSIDVLRRLAAEDPPPEIEKSRRLAGKKPMVAMKIMPRFERIALPTTGKPAVPANSCPDPKSP
jgi:L-ascorbate metabolism protein UlaG (beta-lactamase superfamily)